MVSSKIEADLLEVSKLKVKKNEDRQAYLTRLMLAVSKVSDQVWEDLAEESKDWNNWAAENYQAGAPLEDFPDLEEPLDDFTPPAVEANGHSEEAVPAFAQEPEIEQTDKKKRKKKQDVEDLTDEFGPPRRAGTGKKISACHVVKKMVVRKPTITVSEILDKLKENNLKVTPVTVATLRSSIRDTPFH